MALSECIDLQRRILLRGTASLVTVGGLSACGGGGAESEKVVPLTATPSKAPAPAPATPAPPAAPAPAPTPTPTPSPAPTPTAPPLPPAPAAPLPSPPLSPTPAWAASIPIDRWHTFTGTAFAPWARANIPRGAYLGNDPFDSIVNAYCDPGYSPWAGKQFFYGGGHGDGTCNAVCQFDHATLAWSLVGQPTPPAKYPTSYVNDGAQPGPLVYPSGLSGSGFFLSNAQLNAAADLPFSTPLARTSTHMYAAAAMRGTTVYYFYLTYGEFDTATGQWAGYGVDIGAQLTRFRPEYGTVPLQQGTVATYDEVSDRFFVTLNPGDSGGGWRSGIMVFNPTTRTIESIHETNDSTYGLVGNSMSVCRVGRVLYCFTKTGNYGASQVMNQGFMFNMDTKAYRRFTLVGDTDGSTFPYSGIQETIPTFYDGAAIRRWNYAPQFVNKMFSVNLSPISGTGATDNPYVLLQTARTIGGTAPARGVYVFSRFVFNGGANCAMLLPEAGAEWIALKLS